MFVNMFHSFAILVKRKGKEQTSYRIDFPRWLGRLCFKIFHGGKPEDD